MGSEEILTDGKEKVRSRLTPAERAEQLLDVAFRTFVRLGYEGTSVEKVASEAGVTKPVIYTYFRSKEDLYTEVLVRQQNTFSAAVQERVGPRFSAEDPETTIRTVYEEMFRYAAEGPEVARFIYSRFTDGPKGFAEQQEEWRREHLDRMAGLFAGTFRQMSEEDSIAAGYAVAISMSSVGRFGTRMVLKDPAGTDTDHLAHLLARTVVHGVAGLGETEGLSGSIDFSR